MSEKTNKQTNKKSQSTVADYNKRHLIEIREHLVAGAASLALSVRVSIGVEADVAVKQVQILIRFV